MPAPLSNFSVSHAVLMRRISFVALLVTFTVLGVWEMATEQADGGPAFALASIVPVLLIGVWCLFDGRIRGKPLNEAALLGIFLVTLVAFPIYCVWSRGLRGVWFCVGFGVILSLALFGGAGIGWLWVEALAT